jgi:hypothetical protein
MNEEKTMNPFRSPIVGLAPVLAFFILDFFFSYQYALLGGVIVCAVFFAFYTLIPKASPPYPIRVTTFVFLLTAIFSFIQPFDILYISQSSILFEIFIVIVFFVFILIKNYFRSKIFLRADAIRDLRLLKFDAEVYVIRIVFHLAIMHLLIVLVYYLFPSEYHSESLDRFICFDILFIFITSHFLFEFVYFSLIRRKFVSEEWLPVVDKTGTVHGKVSLRVSESSGNKYLHPVVRVALVHKGMLFLRDSSVDKGVQQLDYPFETYLKYKETLDDGVKRIFERIAGIKNMPYHYVFRYVFETEETNRLIYLYVSNIHEEPQKEHFQLRNGKWWTGKQIEENLGIGLFSEYFEKEYELLKSTVLMGDKLMNNNT